MKHTKGPFSFRTAANGDCGITAPGCVVVAETYADIRRDGEGARDEAIANARLFCAAEEMLNELKASKAAWANLIEIGVLPDRYAATAKLIIEKQSAVIKRAEGEAS